VAEPLGLHGVEQAGRGGRPDREVDPAATGPQLAGQEEQRRGAVAAADQHAALRRLGRGERPAERSEDVDHVVGPEPGQGPGPGPDHVEHDLHGAERRPRALDPVDRERPPQRERAVVPGQHVDELPGPGRLGDPGRHHGERLVGPGPPPFQHLTQLADRAHARS
jgi:hypothetical protein